MRKKRRNNETKYAEMQIRKKKRNEKNFSTVWVVVYMVAGGYRDWTVCVGRSRALCSPALVRRAKRWTIVWAARQQQRAANLNVNWSGRRPPLPRAGDVVLVVATAAPAAAYPSSSWKGTCCYFFFPSSSSLFSSSSSSSSSILVYLCCTRKCFSCALFNIPIGHGTRLSSTHRGHQWEKEGFFFLWRRTIMTIIIIMDDDGVITTRSPLHEKRLEERESVYISQVRDWK